MNNTYFGIDYSILPEGFMLLEDEPRFNPAIHLQLEQPSEVYSLADLGYDQEEIATCPSDFGATSVFRILSDEGAACLLDVCKQLEAFTTSNERIQRTTRGGVYRSQFLRDLCLSPDVTEFMSAIAGTDLMPHTMPHQLGHLNYAPAEIGKNVDKWHVDTLRYDYVMFVTDPTKNEGGAFQYYRGTKHEVAALKAAGKPLDPNKVISPKMPGPGYAVMQQGNMVVHQAKGLTAVGERITMVNGYINADPTIADYTRYDQLVMVDPNHVVTAEYNRHASLHAQRLLNQAISNLGYSEDHQEFAGKLSEAAAILQHAAEEIRNGDEAVMEHFGD